MQVAAEHAEAVGEGTGMGVKKRLLLNGIALHAGGVSPWNEEGASAIEADFADSGLAVRDGATVSAGEAADTIVVEFFVKRGGAFADALVEDLAEGRHWTLEVF